MLLLLLLSLTAMDRIFAPSFAAPLDSIPELPVLGTLGAGPCMDAVVEGDRLYAIGRGKLHIADLSEPKKTRLLATLNGLGNTRQIVVDDGVAYISSREDGVYIVDISEPGRPTLLCHYDSIELATGLALAGDVLFVAQRIYGVEQVDVSDPANPRHLSTVRTGEAQSVTYHDGYLYAGIWARSEVVVVDMRDARVPRIVKRVKLDGFGDGVEVRNGYLYAATGHHSREAHAKEGDPGFGRGHGLEIFDLSDPVSPTFVGRIKFPPFYHIGYDMWSVSVVDGHAFVADTHNGIFVVDVRDPSRPEIVAHHGLPVPEGREVPAFYGGLAVGDGVIYGAGGWTDLHVLAAPDLARPIPVVTGAAPQIGPVAADDNDRVLASFNPPGQVHAAAVAGDLPFAVAACGSDGLHVLRLGDGSLESLSHVPTNDFATDVCIRGRIVYAAEGTGGLSIRKLSADGRLENLGSYQPDGRRVRFVSVPSPGKHALLEVGSGRLHVVDVSRPDRPRLALEDSHLGLFYGYQLLDELVDGRYAAAFWHVDGIHWYDLSTDPPRLEGGFPPGRFGMRGGLALFHNRILGTCRRGYVLFPYGEKRPISELPVHRIPEKAFEGKPTVSGPHLYVADRVNGEVTIADLSEPESPVLLDSFQTRGNPGRIAVTKGGYLVPNGYGGLLLCRLPTKP